MKSNIVAYRGWGWGGGGMMCWKGQEVWDLPLFHFKRSVYYSFSIISINRMNYYYFTRNIFAVCKLQYYSVLVTTPTWTLHCGHFINSTHYVGVWSSPIVCLVEWKINEIINLGIYLMIIIWEKKYNLSLLSLKVIPVAVVCVGLDFRLVVALQLSKYIVKSNRRNER